MYIDERLIKILETHKEEQIHVTYAIDLIKKIAKEYEAQSKAQNKELLLDFIKFMRYINKNQITKFLVEEIQTKNVGQQWLINIYLINNDVIELYKDTKEECIALAEELGLTLID